MHIYQFLFKKYSSKMHCKPEEVNTHFCENIFIILNDSKCGYFFLVLLLLISYLTINYFRLQLISFARNCHSCMLGSLNVARQSCQVRPNPY